MAKYRVARNASIVGPDDKLYTEGRHLPPEVFTKKVIEVHLRSGFAEPVNTSDERPAPDHIPGAEPKAMKGLNQDSDETIRVNSNNPNAITTKVTQPNQSVSQDVSPWVLDPASLKGKSLDELNVLVIERDPSQKPFETVEEVTAFLSQDFKPR